MNDDTEKVIYEYSLLRYVPDIERGEFINIGLLMMCKRQRWLRGEILIREQIISTLSLGKNDISVVKRQASLFTRQDVPQKDIPVEEKYRWLVAVKSAILQTSPSHTGILRCRLHEAKEKLNVKFEELFERLVK